MSFLIMKRKRIRIHEPNPVGSSDESSLEVQLLKKKKERDESKTLCETWKEIK